MRIQRARLALYGLVGVALLAASIAAPGAWATSSQTNLAQTVPTRTPKPGPVDPTQPPPEDTAAPPPNTPQPVTTPVPPAAPPASTPAPGGSLSLNLAADRTAVWPGATVTFTLTVTNSGATPLRQIAIEDMLAQGLEPGAVVSGGATWQGRTLRLSAATLAPGAKLVVIYTARVTAVDANQAIVARATATAAGGIRKTAVLTLGLPPSELPATGACVRP
jgi:uncharacterized repeat protein (TIGR01451 family)